MHIAGNPAALTPAQREWIALAAALGERFAARAGRNDLEATFPADNFAELRDAGLIRLCVPQSCGGLGGELDSALLVTAEIGRHCGATALAFGMHLGACLWSGPVADALTMTPVQRAEHALHRAAFYAQIVDRGTVFSQPFSEGGAAGAGKAAFSTLATRVAGGYRVKGRKQFASLAGMAGGYAVLCTRDRPGATERDALLLALPAQAPGVEVVGDWDALGMRATVSRTLVFDDVIVPESARLLPEGLYWEAAQRHPAMHLLLAPAYLGIAQAAYDFCVAFLRAEVPGIPAVARRQYPTKQIAVAQMRITLEQTRALFVQTALEAHIDPDEDARLRLYASHYAVMENAQAVCALALRTCGGQALMKALPLERLYRDARCGALMLPWSAELCLDHLGRESLYRAGEDDETLE